MSKKIVFAIDTNSPGGAERVIATLANYFAGKGYDTTVINSDTESSFYGLLPGVRVVKMGLDGKKGGRLVRMCAKYSFLKKYFKKEKPDAAVAFLQNMEIPAVLAALSAKTRIFTSVRNSMSDYSAAVHLFRRIFYPKITGAVFQSEQVAQHPYFSKLKNSAVIMNPLTTFMTERAVPVAYAERKDIILNIGRLEAQKNQKLLINAFSDIAEEYPEAELIICGEGSLRDELTGLIESRGLSGRVKLVGVVDNAAEKYKDAKMFVMSSDFEGFPNALAEALVAGIPCISTDFDTKTASQLIKNGENGFLVPVADRNALSDAMRRVLDMGEETDRLAQNAVRLYDILNADAVCSLWERFIFGND